MPKSAWASRSEDEMASIAAHRPAGPAAALGAAVLGDGGAVVLTVADTGAGIADVDAAFAPRDRDAVPDAVHGLGIGLPLSRELARRRGGDVWIVDAGGTGRGAVVAARLPDVLEMEET